MKKTQEELLEELAHLMTPDFGEGISKEIYDEFRLKVSVPFHDAFLFAGRDFIKKTISFLACDRTTDPIPNAKSVQFQIESFHFRISLPAESTNDALLGKDFLNCLTWMVNESADLKLTTDPFKPDFVFLFDISDEATSETIHLAVKKG